MVPGASFLRPGPFFVRPGPLLRTTYSAVFNAWSCQYTAWLMHARPALCFRTKGLAGRAYHFQACPSCGSVRFLCLSKRDHRKRQG